MSRDERKKGAEAPAVELHLVGISHHTASGELREAIAYSEPEAARWVDRAVEEGAVDLGGYRIQEAVLLSTCNRTEAYLVLAPSAADSGGSRGKGPDGGRGDGRERDRREVHGGGRGDGRESGRGDGRLESRLVRLLCGSHLEMADHPEVFYRRKGGEAARHLLRVASGLDSMVQGEAQILGQVHRAFELAREVSGVGPVLDRLFATAFRGAKRARTETEIGRGAVSVASAAVDLAIKVVGSLSKRTALVIGAGETGRLAAQHLANQSPHGILIANRTFERAEALAREVGGQAWPLSSLPEVLPLADVVVVAAGSPVPLISKELAHEVRRHRRRSTVYIDISIPRNIDPSVRDVEDAFVYDMDALEKIVDANLARRAEEVPRVEAILEEEIVEFHRWIASLSAGPTIVQLRERFETLRQEEIRRHARNLGSQELEVVDRVTRGLLNKLLHGPTAHLRNAGSADPESVEVIRRVFQLDPPEEPVEERRGGSGMGSEMESEAGTEERSEIGPGPAGRSELRSDRGPGMTDAEVDRPTERHPRVRMPMRTEEVS